MPKYRGRVDCYLNPPTGDSLSAAAGDSRYGIGSRAVGEAFTNIVNFLSSSSDLGIEMISANYGISGQGFGFWDSNSPSGRRGWACFRFHSASLGKFDCLVFQMTGSNNESFGNPVRLVGQSTTNQYLYPGTFLGISFASHPSGSNTTQSDGPWNGDYSLTSGTIGNPLWKVNSSGKAAFFPRENGVLGVLSGSRAYLDPILSPDIRSDVPSYPIRLHVITSEDSLTIVSDMSNNGTHKVLHFGSYTPRVGMTPTPDSPYFMFMNSTDNSVPIPNFYSTAVGSRDGASSSTQALADGGIAHPDISSGSKSVSFASLNITQTIGYNSYVNSGSFEIGNLFPVINEPHGFYGTLGVANHIKYAVGPVNRSVSENSSSAVFGRDTLSEAKFVVPWSGDAPNTTGLVRTGRNFSVG